MGNEITAFSKKDLKCEKNEDEKDLEQIFTLEREFYVEPFRNPAYNNTEKIEKTLAKFAKTKKDFCSKFRAKALLSTIYRSEEKFDEGYSIYEFILNDPKANDAEKAYALVGMGNCVRMKSEDGADKAMELYKKAFETYPKTATAAHAMLSYAYLLSYSGDKKQNAEAKTFFEKCYEKYPASHYGEDALARLVINNANKDKPAALKFAEIYTKEYKNGAFNDIIKNYIKQLKEERQ